MKKTIFSGLIVMLLILGCTRELAKSSQGTWQMVSWKNMWGDTLVEEFPGDYTGSDLLIISDTHLLSIGRFTKYNATIVNNFTGATRKVEGNHCEETLLYFPDQDKVGSKVKSILELSNDTLIKTYPCDDNWVLKRADYTIEKYVRVK